MEYLDVNFKVLKQIINDIQEGIEYQVIANMYGYSYEDFKDIVKSFCDHYNFQIVVNKESKKRRFISTIPEEKIQQTQKQEEPKEQEQEKQPEHKEAVEEKVDKKEVSEESNTKETSKGNEKQKEQKKHEDEKPEKQTSESEIKQDIPKRKDEELAEKIQQEIKQTYSEEELESQEEETGNHNEVYLRKMNELRDWCYKNNRLPRKIENNGEAITKEDFEEKKFYELLHFVKEIIINNSHIYGTDISKNEFIMSLFEIVVEVENAFRNKSEYRLYKSALILKKWTDETGIKPEQAELKSVERKMFDYLVRLRRDCNESTIPEDKKFYLRYVLEKVNSKHGRTDMGFLETLKKSTGREDIILSPMEIEVLKGFSDGKKISSISATTGVSIEKIYEITDSFCKKYNCKVVFNSKTRKGQKDFIPNSGIGISH